jgi:probable rRNA maturation factor
MAIKLHVQFATEFKELPSFEEFLRWTSEVLGTDSDTSVVIRLVDRAESAELNQSYRRKSGPTNVLSFPFEVPSYVRSAHLGDLIICAPVVIEQAREQGKSVPSHWAHMVVHGLLHLKGYDHQAPGEASEMEALEIEILARLGYPDPYHANAG